MSQPIAVLMVKCIGNGLYAVELHKAKQTSILTVGIVSKETGAASVGN